MIIAKSTDFSEDFIFKTIKSYFIKSTTLSASQKL